MEIIASNSPTGMALLKCWINEKTTLKTGWHPDYLT
jgi:hypothetical protein